VELDAETLFRLWPRGEQQREQIQGQILKYQTNNNRRKKINLNKSKNKTCTGTFRVIVMKKAARMPLFNSVSKLTKPILVKILLIYFNPLKGGRGPFSPPFFLSCPYKKRAVLKI
jgi:hypothetical protein